MKNQSLTKTAKRTSSRFMETFFTLLPAIGGGALGAALGRNSLLAGGALLTYANMKKLPGWVHAAAIGMAANGVATTRPVTQQAVAATAEGNLTVDANGQLQGFKLLADNPVERGEQYLKNILWNFYADKIPVVNKVVGLSGIDSDMFAPIQSTKINMNPAQRAELNRIMEAMEQQALPSGTSVSSDAVAIPNLGSLVDASLFRTGLSGMDRRRRMIS